MQISNVLIQTPPVGPLSPREAFFEGGGASSTHQSVTVGLGGERDYVIRIGPGVLAQAGAWLGPLARGGRVVVITQPVIAARYGDALTNTLRAADLDVHVVPFASGERWKTLATVRRLYQALYDLRADRETLILALGGGVVGDVAGFVAATYARGLPYVQIPTTLLAMVDSSVGGKTGVDFGDGKNLIGAFHQPRLVLIDTNTLQTLPVRDRRSGMAEVVKYGVIRDPGLLAYLQNRVKQVRSLAPDAVSHVVSRSCAIKAEVVAGDEREETGLRAVLNYGHTLGHALEAATRYRRFRHGEAVAIGMVGAACVGEVLGITPSEVRESIADALLVQGLPVAVPPDVPAAALIERTSLDKKAQGGRARFVLARALGDVQLVGDVSAATVQAGLARQCDIYGLARKVHP